MQEKLYDVPYITDIRDMIDKTVLDHPENVAFTYKENGEFVNVSYSVLRRSINFLGTALTDMGLKGKKVMLCSDNCYNWCLCYLSVVCGVGVIVPADKELTDEELNNIQSVSGAAAVIADSKILSRISKRRNVIYINMDTSLDDLQSRGRELLRNGKNEYLNAEINPDALGALLFTSGTTGLAKGVMLSQRNICSDIMSAASIICIKSTDVELSVLPLHHAYECLVFLELMYAGGCVAFGGGIRRLTEAFSEFRPTFLCVVPLIIEKMHAKIISNASKSALSIGKKAVKVSGKAGLSLEKKVFSKIHEFFGNRLRFIITGAAAVDPKVASDFIAFGIPIIIGYGLTECSPIAICNNDKNPKPDSVGQPIPGTEAMLSGKSTDGIGELCIKGPMVMLGYYKDAQATRAVMRDGWFHTGDLAVCDSEGYYKITGRVKNIIVTKTGKNIYPEELEYYLCSCPAVMEAVVYGIQDSNDIRIAAEIYPDKDEIKKQLGAEPTRQDILLAVSQAVKNVNRTLPGYKSIYSHTIRENEFPKTTTKKIKRAHRE